MSAPVDPTSTTAWSTLTALRADLAPDLRAWFAADPGRAERFTLDAGDLLHAAALAQDSDRALRAAEIEADDTTTDRTARQTCAHRRQGGIRRGSGR